MFIILGTKERKGGNSDRWQWPCVDQSSSGGFPYLADLIICYYKCYYQSSSGCFWETEDRYNLLRFKMALFYERTLDSWNYISLSRIPSHLKTDTSAPWFLRQLLPTPGHLPNTSSPHFSQLHTDLMWNLGKNTASRIIRTLFIIIAIPSYMRISHRNRFRWWPECGCPYAKEKEKA